MEYHEEKFKELLTLIKDTWDESNPTRKRAIWTLAEYGEAMWEEGYEDGIRACQDTHI
jgi:hypothetical protein